jgi:hypothetical protein
MKQGGETSHLRLYAMPLTRSLGRMGRHRDERVLLVTFITSSFLFHPTQSRVDELSAKRSLILVDADWEGVNETRHWRRRRE